MGLLTGLMYLAILASGFFVGKYSEFLNYPLPYPSTLTVQPLDPDLIPRPTPLTGAFEPNEHLQRATKLFKGKIQGSETAKVGPDGGLYMADKFGYLWRASPAKEGLFALEKEPLAHLGPGRPLGFDFEAAGDVIVCMAGTGLVRFDHKSREVQLLAARVGGVNESEAAIEYANDPAVSRDGTIVFTDSGHGIPPVRNEAGFWDTMAAYLLLTFQGEATGRLLAYEPATHKTRVVAHSFWFPNGVALAPDASYAAVVETNTLRLWRVWLTGPRAGEREVIIEGLPGIPDGVCAGDDGSFWVALTAPNQPVLQHVLPYALLRFVAAWLPSWARPISEWGALVQVTPSGEVLRFVADPHGRHIAHTSSVADAGERLIIGNLGGDYVSVLDKAALPPVFAAKPTRPGADARARDALEL